MPNIEDAIELAVKAHRDQLDKAGAPYILHSLRVMMRMQTEKEQIVAVLHDVLEDTTVDLSLLKKMGYSDEVIEAIKCLTRQSTEPYSEYIERIKSNSLSLVVKIEDLTDNLDLQRIKRPSPEDLKRHAKYKKALKVLKFS